MKGCCPFHGEKTPSFYVYEDGYHCFGCGAHGDAISFVMQIEGAGFMEAVQSLAGEAGLDLPKPTASAEAAERRRMDLHAVLDAAQAHYARALSAPAGAPALAYLRGRGLTDETIARFGLGWAGEGRGALAAALAASGVTQAQLLEAGLLRAGEDGAIRGELFFNRVMFPIRDRSGRMISFGGRTLGDGQPKYVNGPETPLFAKRRTLFAIDLAREANRREQSVVAVEGYMDVIALHQAGFPAAVAPLGTALTAEQLEELWRLSPVPILCFDGDDAGGRAAVRAALTALPLISAERSISFATLPRSEDPDTLVRRHGNAAFAQVLQAARPLNAVLYELLRETGDDKTPEQRARFLDRLMAAAGTIKDRSLSSTYRTALRSRFYERAPKGGRKPGLAELRPDLSASDASGKADTSRARKLTAILLHHPALAHDLEEAYASLNLPPGLSALRHAILEYCARDFPAGETLDSAGLVNHLSTLGSPVELALALEETPSCGRPDAQPAEAEAGWWHFYGLLHRDGLHAAVEDARQAYLANKDDPACFARLNALCLAAFRLRRGEQSGTADADEEIYAYED